MVFPHYSARPLFAQFHLFFHGVVALSVPTLRALAYHELASAALQSEPSCLSLSSLSETDEETLCDRPLTPVQLATFSYAQHKALVSSHDAFFVITKLFSYPAISTHDSERVFLQFEPWRSTDSTCLGCGAGIEANIPAWIAHRDKCTGIEDTMLASVFVQAEITADVKLTWETTSGIARREVDYAFEDKAYSCPEKLAQSRRLVLDWLSKIE